MVSMQLNDPIVDSADGSLLDPTKFVVFDNGGLTVDRYTVLPYFPQQGLPDSTRGMALALSDQPRGANTLGEWVEMSARAVKNQSVDLGRRISWEDLPELVKSNVRFHLSEEGGSFDQVAPEIAYRSKMGF